MQASHTETEKSQAKPSTNEENELTFPAQQPQQQKIVASNDQFIGAGNISRDFVSALGASNIDDIIEEEEEEEDELSAAATKADNRVLQTQLSNVEEEELPAEESSKVVVVGENTKFTLEPVVLDVVEGSPVAKREEAITEEVKDYVAEGSNHEDTDNSATGSNEIRVEEGYATRQMDEFFRQTIAQIKEELTKKLENNNPDEDEDIGDFSDEEESEDDDEYDEDEEDDDVENQRFNIDACNSSKVASKPNRMVLYQQLLSANRSSKPSAKMSCGLKETAATWMVLAGCIINMIIVEGLVFNYPNFFGFVEREWDVRSKLVASLPTVFLLAVFLLATPFAVFLAKVHGSRKVCVVGSAVSTVALVLCSFQDNIVGFAVTYGCLNGLGISLIYVPSLISLSKWFLKDRLWACGTVIVIVAGGSASYPILTEFLVDKFGNYATLLILAAVQFNCLVGSLLLVEADAPYSLLNDVCTASKAPKSASFETKSNADPISPQRQRNKDQSVALTTENETGTGPGAPEATPKSPVDIEKQIQDKHTREYQFRKMNNLKRKSALRRNLLIADETRSNVSSSTATTINNYTLKQYWRKFVQTRQDNSKAKKNLFHLIAEEKKKTRTMSKSSLEDGFVITTSNNLLAPNDEENVIIFDRKAALLKNLENRNNISANSDPGNTNNDKPKTATSRFLTRFANSIRSIAKSTTLDLNNTTDTTVSTLKIPGIASEDVEAAVTKTKKQPNSVTYSEKLVDYEQDLSNKSPNEKEQHEYQLPKQLISVFDGPITDESLHSVPEHTTPTTSDNSICLNQMPANLASVFTPLTNLEKDLQTNLISPNEINFSENNSDEDESYHRSPTARKKRHRQHQKSTSSSEHNNNNEDDEEEETPTSYVKNFSKNNSGVTPNSILKTSRYLGYRSSLSNSVRGSLMEYTVPENDVHNELDNNLDSASVNFSKPHQHYTRRTKERQQRGQNHSQKTNTRDQSGEGLFSLGFNPQVMNARRFVSTVDASGFINHPVNLEGIEYNLRNSLIKKNSDYYRRNQKIETTPNSEKSSFTLIRQYLGYVFSFDLLLNALLLVVNFSFLVSAAGTYTILVYFFEFCQKQNISEKQSMYLMFLIVFIHGLSRLFAIVLFRCNESTTKSRIFTHNLTLVLMGLTVLAATVICDTVFSLTMFAIVFGSLFGLNANLRTTVIYDILGLNWSDDCLFAYNSFAQGLGILGGLPIAGALYDYTDNYKTVFYFSGTCFILSGLILSPGKKLTVHFSDSYKAMNRLYFQKK